MMISQPQNLRPCEAAEYVRHAPQTLAKLRCYGGGPRYIKSGRLVLYARADLDAWLESKKRASTSEAA